jgi:DNA-binding SARP family transcriptional activator
VLPGTVVEFRILGPLEVVDREQLSLGGRKQQAVLAVLLLHRGEVVAADRLIEAIWAGRAPATAGKTLQVYVSNLRKALGDGVLITQGRGYMLAVEPDQVDSDRFEKLAARGREALEHGDLQKARTWLQAALTLWRGPALADFSYENFAQSEIARLDEVRMAALEYRIEADLRLGQHAALVPELEALVHEHPLRERLYEHLMLALYRSGRQVDALERYQRARRKLIDEFGVEPGPRLQELQRAVLTHDTALDLQGRSRSRGQARSDEPGAVPRGRVRALAAVLAFLRAMASRLQVLMSRLPALASRLPALVSRVPGALSRLAERARRVVPVAGEAERPPSHGQQRLPRGAAKWLAAGASAVVILVVVLIATSGGSSQKPGALVDWARISSPAPGGTYTRGQSAATSFSCGKASNGPSLASCNDSTGAHTAAGGTGHLDTSNTGAHLYTVSVTAKNGATKTTNITYTVVPPLNLSIEAARATVLHGRTEIRLACSGGGPGTACRGRLSLSVARRRGPTVQMSQVASARFSVPAGATASIPLSLLAAAQQTLGHDSGHRLRVLATTRLADGQTADRVVTLRRHR